MSLYIKISLYVETSARKIQISPKESPMSKDFGIREGEVTADLPAQFDPGLYFIGRHRAPGRETQGLPKARGGTRRSLHRRTGRALGGGLEGPGELQPHRRAIL